MEKYDNEEIEETEEEESAKHELIELHSEAMLQFDEIQSALKDERQQCLNDRRFYSIAGAQWEGDISKHFENKPKIEVNKIHLSVIRIINEYRNNKVDVDFTSKDGAENDKLADTCDGLFRADEQDSNADEAYDNGFEESVGGGIGAWRLRNEYEDPYDDEDDRQRIIIDPIYDADTSVFFDLDSKKQDKSDAKHCFVITSMTPAKYEKQYGEDISSVNKAVSNIEFDWNTPDTTYIAEYYKCEIRERVIRIFKPLLGEEEKFSPEAFENDEELETKLLAQGYKEIDSKKVKQKKIHKYILSGTKVIEDCGLIAGNNIPIVLTYGKRWFIDNVERVMGHVRLARDSQVLSNIQLSKLAEISALSAVEKPIVLPEQMAGHAVMWSEDNVNNVPYLFLNPITDKEGNDMPAGVMAYTKPPTIPPGLAALLAITSQDMNEVLGNQQAAEKMVSNIAEDTVALIKESLDMQTYIYISNFAKAKKRTAEIWLSMQKDIIVEDDRQMKVLDKEGNASIVKLGIPFDDNGKIVYQNDLSSAKFGVNIEIGPATSSKRTSTVKNLMKALAATNDPETQQVLSALIMMNMEGEGLSDIRPFFRKKLLKLGAVTPTDEENETLIAEAQNIKPTPEQTFLEAEAEKAVAATKKLEAETIETLADTEKTKADTIKVYEDIETENLNQLKNTVKELDETIKQEGNRTTELTDENTQR